MAYSINLPYEQQLGLGMSAMYVIAYKMNPFTLSGFESGFSGAFTARVILSKEWQIEEQENLISWLKWLFEEGDRTDYSAGKNREDEIISWDLCRLIFLARLGTAAGILKEPEAWKWIALAVSELRGVCRTWNDFADRFLKGYKYYTPVVDEDKDDDDNNNDDEYVNDDEEDDPCFKVFGENKKPILLDSIVSDLLDYSNKESLWHHIRWIPDAQGRKKAAEIRMQLYH